MRTAKPVTAGRMCLVQCVASFLHLSSVFLLSSQATAMTTFFLTKNTPLFFTFMDTAAVTHKRTFEEHQQRFLGRSVPFRHQNLGESGTLSQPRLERLLRRTQCQFGRQDGWKWLSAVQLLASKVYLIELVLAGCKCGESLTNVACTPFTCKLTRLYNRIQCT